MSESPTASSTEPSIKRIQIQRIGTAQARAACRRLHVSLCAGQSAFWHSRPQYLTRLHATQLSNLPACVASAVFLQHAQAGTLGSACRRRLEPPREVPSPRLLPAAAPDAWPASGEPRATLVTGGVACVPGTWVPSGLTGPAAEGSEVALGFAPLCRFGLRPAGCGFEVQLQNDLAVGVASWGIKKSGGSRPAATMRVIKSVSESCKERNLA